MAFPDLTAGIAKNFDLVVKFNPCGVQLIDGN